MVHNFAEYFCENVCKIVRLKRRVWTYILKLLDSLYGGADFMGIISRQEKASDPINMNCLMSKFLYDGGEYEVYTQCNTWQNESCGGWQFQQMQWGFEMLMEAYHSLPYGIIRPTEGLLFIL